MLFNLLRYVIAILIGIMGFMVVDSVMPMLSPIIAMKFLNFGILGVSAVKIIAILLGGVIGGIIGYIVSASILLQGLHISKILERILSRIPSKDLIAGAIGLLFGLIIANLIGVAFYRVPFVGPYIPIVLSAILGYLGVKLMVQKGPTLYSTWIENKNAHKTRELTVTDELLKGSAKKRFTAQTVAKLIDTSVIIDGRIKELCKTGFIEGPLVIPVFVLEELQLIADSSDSLKRTRGRRGLDMLREMQELNIIDIIIINDDYPEIQEVDTKLMRLALDKHLKLLTTDFNLNKVASLQGIHVLNLNELANAMKSSLVSGEWIRVDIIKAGKEDNQGIAYLDDGTMIVIEDGGPYIHQSIDVMVTSILQTNAGKMIFARVDGQKDSNN
ncbi:DNA-binding protein [Veillonella montpellierensis DNF00314]|uniref:DNA-binding protein n=1 Tax=Veillonella montpellierensis DNF00314 TaxID=1401067 RepID=A0A096AKR1_9FIRM|nr:PIN domain-containing protein [Veillonella montpellierensis]KGF47683.1 DNA-binding protein [Veillonella montpellierensis DNF00314]